MLSVGEDSASKRGTQICKSALAMGMASGKASKKPVTVGVAQAASDESFDTLVARAIGLAQDGLDEENGPVCMENLPAETA